MSHAITNKAQKPCNQPHNTYIKDRNIVMCIRCDGSYDPTPLELGVGEDWSCRDIAALLEELDFHGMAYETYKDFEEGEV